MKAIKANAPDVIDISAKLSPQGKQRRLVLAICLIGALAFSLWLSYVRLWKPIQYRKAASAVIEEVLPHMEWVGTSTERSGVQTSKLEAVDQSLELARLLSEGKVQRSGALTNEMRVRLAHDFFEYAIGFGNPFARMDYGIALLEGGLGLPDKLAADYQFAQARGELQEPARLGKPREALAYSLLLIAGYGVQKDNSTANSILGQVINELSVNDLVRLKTTPGNRGDLNPVVLVALIAKGYSVTESDIKLACSAKYIGREASASQEMVDHSRDSVEVQRLYFLRYMEIAHEEEKCVSDLNAQLPNHISKSTALPTSIIPQATTNKSPERVQPADIARPQGVAKSVQKVPVTPDVEKQADTGYLNGSPPPVAAGLSTFTVDNKSGGADAVARIYLNGDKPAIRQIYIKTGEKFTAKNLAPERYVLRYRFIGSEDTFEADKIFTLQEVSTDEGTLFSNVSVTLFTVANGNMKVKRVPNEKF